MGKQALTWVPAHDTQQMENLSILRPQNDSVFNQISHEISV